MNKDYLPFLNSVTAKSPLMWVFDLDSRSIIDMTPEMAEFMKVFDITSLTSSVSYAEHLDADRSVIATGETYTLVEWVQINRSWRKLARTKSHLGGNLILEISLDVTHLDPRAEWLARINLVEQRLEMENSESISFDEFVVLHLLLKGYKHRRIAETLTISPKTVEYRISRLKNALEAETTEDMMMKVSSSGMIYLAMIPIDLNDPAQSELDLYRRVQD
jgi:DNA-binding NarL/FixJ family response regulator